MSRVYMVAGIVVFCWALITQYEGAIEKRTKLEVAEAQIQSLANQVASVAENYNRQLQEVGRVLQERDADLRRAEARLYSARKDLASIPTGGCFDSRIPDSASSVLLQLPGVSNQPGGVQAAPADPAATGGATEASKAAITCRGTAEWIAEYNAVVERANDDRRAIKGLVESHARQ